MLDLPHDATGAFNWAADADPSPLSYLTTRRVLIWLDELYSQMGLLTMQVLALAASAVKRVV